MKKKIKDHLHLWKVMLHAARHSWESGCAADWEDAASYAYQRFIDQVGEDEDKWDSPFVYVFGKRKTRDYQRLLWGHHDRDVKKRAKLLEVHNELIESYKPSREKVFVKCLSDIGKLMDARLYSNATVKTSTILDEIVGGERPRNHRFGEVSEETALRVGITRRNCHKRICNIRKNDQARAIWSKYKEKAHS